MNGAFIKWGNLDTHTLTWTMPFEDQVEIRMMLLHAKECQRLPPNHQKLEEEHGKRASS